MLELIKEKWDEVLNTLKQDDNISEVAYTTWIKYFRPYKVQGNTFLIFIDKNYLIVPVEWFDKKYQKILNAIIKNVVGVDLDVKFIVPEELD